MILCFLPHPGQLEESPLLYDRLLEPELVLFCDISRCEVLTDAAGFLAEYFWSSKKMWNLSTIDLKDRYCIPNSRSSWSHCLWIAEKRFYSPSTAVKKALVM
jgi:hypothetical protein